MFTSLSTLCSQGVFEATKRAAGNAADGARAMATQAGGATKDAAEAIKRTVDGSSQEQASNPSYTKDDAFKTAPVSGAAQRLKVTFSHAQVLMSRFPGGSSLKRDPQTASVRMDKRHMASITIP